MADDYGHGSSDDEYKDRADDDVDDEWFQEHDSGSDFSGPIVQAPSCKVIRKESLIAAQEYDLQTVMELLSAKKHQARALLIHHLWDVDKVSAVFVEKGKEFLYKEASLPVVDNDNPSSSHSFSEISCQICYKDVSANETTTMECGHCFCNGCWTEHFIMKINEGQSKRITCMADKCSSICDEGEIQNLVRVRDPELAEKFDKFLLESYIDDNKRVKWCPSAPNCGNAIRIENDEYCEVECACGEQFCFKCRCKPHSPCTCQMWDLWLKESKELKSINWVVQNVKICPKCNKPVQKNGGCNLVLCICGQPFCWLCGSPTGKEYTWIGGIRNHRCGRYKDEHGQGIEQARKEQKRYMHYRNHYQAHANFLNAEENKKEKLLQKMTTLESREWESKDHSWILDALHRLTTSRRILSYSYPFAYFTFGKLFDKELSSEEKTIKQNLFEDHQQQLERDIERLSMLLDSPVDESSEDAVSDMRMKTIDFSAATDNSCKNLYDRIENELLGCLQEGPHIIVPYRSKGVEKASEL